MERREFTRVPLRFPIELSAEDRGRQDARTRNLSLRGACVECDGDCEEGQECELRLRLGEGPEAVVIEIVGRVVRSERGELAVEFSGVRGVDSLGHLRNLLLYNSERPEEVEREIRLRRGIERLPTRRD